MADVEQWIYLYHVGDVQVGLVIVPEVEGAAVYAITIGWVSFPSTGFRGLGVVLRELYEIAAAV